MTFDLVRLMTTGRAKELAEVRGDLDKLAKSAKTPTLRQLGYVMLIAADGGVDKAWDQAVQSASSLLDLVNAMPLIRDPGQRAALYPKVLPLIKNVSAAASTDKDKPIVGRFVRIELPGEKRTLTLAEVEVYSAGKNIARKEGVADWHLPEGGGRQAIDGITSGKYKDGGMTHTEEDIANPWWEVDLGGGIRSNRL